MKNDFAANSARRMTVRFLGAAALLLVSPLCFSNHTRAAAQDNKSGATEKVTVVAHIPLPGSAVRQIFMQNEKGKQYLLLQQNTHFTVVDVTDPKKPQIVDRTAGQGKLTEVGAGLAISVQSDKSSQDPVATQTVRLVDLSDPKNPHTVKTLNGVTSLYSDDGRQLIYIANNEGLWVIKHNETFRLPMCTSDSYENTVAQCQ
jgi:hypothetical protein